MRNFIRINLIVDIVIHNQTDRDCFGFYDKQLTSMYRLPFINKARVIFLALGVIILCSGFVWQQSLSINVQHNEKNVLISISGGEPPYSTTVAGSSYQLQHFSTPKIQIPAAKSGQYFVIVQDSNKDISQLQFEVDQ